jgi:hypothetical protein
LESARVTRLKRVVFLNSRVPELQKSSRFQNRNASVGRVRKRSKVLRVD